jgi:hypothetical protein
LPPICNNTHKYWYQGENMPLPQKQKSKCYYMARWAGKWFL